MELKLTKKAGLVDSSTTVAWNPFIIVVKKVNPFKVKTPADLKKANLNLPLHGRRIRKLDQRIHYNNVGLLGSSNESGASRQET
jgi:hypothetical protein